MTDIGDSLNDGEGSIEVETSYYQQTLSDEAISDP